MMDRKLQKELAEILESVEGIFAQLDWSDSQQVQDVLEILGAVDGKCKENLSKEAYAKYDEIFTGLAEIVQDTDWKRLSIAEQTESCDLCREIMGHVVKMLKTEKEVKMVIVFLPYKASMWDSLESVWRAAHEDKEHCEAYVVPIPYFDRKEDTTPAEWHCEADLFPKDVPVCDFREFSLEKLKEMRPDAIFIHNPYDNYNRVTCIDAQYFSHELKKCTDALVYIPYYASGEFLGKDIATAPGVINADYVIAQDENIKKQFEDYYPGEAPEGKFLALGSPKFDKVAGKTADDFELPEEWKRKMEGKKVILYNTSIGAVLQHPNQVCSKMRHVFSVFKQRKDVVIWWRPHPLLKATLNSMIPGLLEKYEQIEREFLQEDYGIYDDTPDVSRAVVCTDAYYGDESSVVQLYEVTKKPIMIQSMSLTE